MWFIGGSLMTGLRTYWQDMTSARPLNTKHHTKLEKTFRCVEMSIVNSYETNWVKLLRHMNRFIESIVESTYSCSNVLQPGKGSGRSLRDWYIFC
jgi:hypothetical protein